MIESFDASISSRAKTLESESPDAAAPGEVYEEYEAEAPIWDDTLAYFRKSMKKLSEDGLGVRQ